MWRVSSTLRVCLIAIMLNTASYLCLLSAILHAAQKYTIRDLNTGQLFVVDAEPSPAMEALAQGPPGSPTAGGSQQLVTDVSSGREMSLEEFDRALGLHSALEVCICAAILVVLFQGASKPELVACV